MDAFKAFSELRLPPPLLESLELMNFRVPTAIQASSIPPALRGKDILGIAPTGTGKTAAFGIPALAFLYPRPGKQVLVLAPTRELATQIFRFMRKMGEPLHLKGSLVVGGESFSRQKAESKQGVDYLIATPGRLMDHLAQGLSLAQVNLLVLDEVDRMLDMGFAPQVEKIVSQLHNRRQTFLFSATMPPEIHQLADRYLKDPSRTNVAKNPALAPKITEEIVATTDLEKPRLLIDQIAQRSGKILVFANTQGRVEQVTRRIKHAGHSVACIHAGRTHGERKQALDAFRRGEVRVLVATDLVSRGIDVLDIAHVINFDYPTTQDDYLHRIGRTGRIGKQGQAVTFTDERRKPRPASIKKIVPAAKSTFSKKPKRAHRIFFKPGTPAGRKPPHPAFRQRSGPRPTRPRP